MMVILLSEKVNLLSMINSFDQIIPLQTMNDTTVHLYFLRIISSSMHASNTNTLNLTINDDLMTIKLFCPFFSTKPTIEDCFWSIDFCNGDFYLNVSNNFSLNLYTGNQIHFLDKSFIYF